MTRRRAANESEELEERLLVGWIKELGGKGVGSTLARGALEDVRRRGLRVVAQCPFIKGFIDKHAEFSDLLA